MTISGILPRDGSTLDYIRLWDQGCVKTTLNERKAIFMHKLEVDEKAELRAKHFKKQLKLGKPLPPLPPVSLAQGEKEKRYGEKARKLAEKILEQERQNYVDFRQERDKNLIIEILRKLRFLTWTVDAEGKPTKVKIIMDRVTEPDHGGNWRAHDIHYIGDRTSNRLNQINSLKNRLAQLRAYAPYYSPQIRILYEEAVAMGSLEYVHKKDLEKEKKPVKKPEPEVTVDMSTVEEEG